MKGLAVWLIVVIAVGGGVYWYVQSQQEPAGEAARGATQSAVSPDEGTAAIEHPIPPLPPAGEGSDGKADAEQPAAESAPAETQQPLPPLNESDPLIRSSLEDVYAPGKVENWFILDNIVRRLVATVDNIPRQRLALKHRPVANAPGRFQVETKDDTLILSSENFARYTPYVELLESVPMERVVRIYIRYYPLFQQAYEQLGYPSRYFNDRMMAAIDHLLATPDVQGPIRLIRPHVLYEYADPELENLSAGQKVLLRMGGENAERVKAKLREVRRLLTRDPAFGQ